MTKHVRHLVDEAWDAVPISTTGGRFPVLCGQLVGIEAVTHGSRPICANCYTTLLSSLSCCITSNVSGAVSVRCPAMPV